MSEQINLKIAPIADGTVLDHLPTGSAIKILELLDDSSAIISVATNINSTRLGKKDLVYIDGRVLEKDEKDKVGLIAPGSTINVIEGHDIKSKEILESPVSFEGMMKCGNDKCITNHEDITTKFTIKKEPARAKCFYCEKEFSEDEIRKMLS